MRALTIRQPWASMIVEGSKRYEFRKWRTEPGETFLVHAGLGREGDIYSQIGRDIAADPSGAILGTVEIVAVTRVTGENVEVLARGLPRRPQIGHYAWQLASPRQLQEPIPYTPKRGVVTWSYPELDPALLVFSET